MKPLIFLAVFTIFFSSCSSQPVTPSETDIQAAIEQTQAAQPTPTTAPTETPVPLSELDLTPLLIQEGDLPAGLSEGQYRDSPWGSLEKTLPPPDGFTGQMFERQGEGGGFVVVYLYDDLAMAENALTLAIEGWDSPILVDDLGERGYFDVTSTRVLLGGEESTSYFHFRFKQCHAMVSAMMIDADREGVLTYARRLADRLAPLVCR